VNWRCTCRRRSRDTTLRLGIAFAILFVLVLIAGGILGVLANRLVRGTGLTGTDRSLGVIFGSVARRAAGGVLVFLAWLTPLTEEGWWEQSRLASRIRALVNWLLDQLPQSLQERLRELAGRSMIPAPIPFQPSGVPCAQW
jgi:membrane protein required for colicin V production